ncbi:MAG: cell division protein FtsZ [Synergistaceae bacterium]|jgi:cell division protein FtsZ|nr:cell division protein FtsZ [Synergistaceae bacterium]
MGEEQNFYLPEISKQREHLLVIGVGGGGGNALNHIIESGITDVEFVAANTDFKALSLNKAPHKIILGEKLTKGLGAGADPVVGMDAAKESIDHIRECLTGSDMVFVTAGMGGGTGTGAAPIIAEVARELGILIVGVVTMPFGFEMGKRAFVAREGIAKLKEKVDALLIVENDRLLALADEKLTMVNAYKMANEVLRQAVQGVTDLILKPGHVNVDFADVRAVMRNAGSAIMGIGIGEGENRTDMAAKAAIKSPLISQPPTGAKGILINFEGGSDLGLIEMSKAAEFVKAAAGAEPDALMVWGHTINDDMGGAVRVTVIATGFPEKTAESGGQRPQPNRAPDDRDRDREEAAPPSPRKSVWPRNFTLEEADLRPADEDMFMGTTKTAYDSPTYLRKKPSGRK